MITQRIRYFLACFLVATNLVMAVVLWPLVILAIRFFLIVEFKEANELFWIEQKSTRNWALKFKP